MDLMLVRLRNGISIILLKSTFLGLGPTLVGFCEDTSKGGDLMNFILLIFQMEERSYESPEVYSQERSEFDFGTLFL
ncbi:hypothetical protein MKX03_010830 [Papaver bracteatum]|nr:hypothetical protein MKX03_010830 [Papaver bracteatum]